MKPDAKNIIKKLFQNTLTQKEESDLLNSSFISDQMYKQWNDTKSVTDENDVDEYKLWQKISSKTINSAQQFPFIRLKHQFSFYKIYSIAASLLILIGLSFFFYSKPQTIVQEDVQYVYCSGFQGVSTIVLPDSTIVKIGPGSKLTYPKIFTGQSREVTLHGQGFFDVTSNKEMPFIVHTTQMDVVALGTAFEIFSYDDNSKIETVLLNGKVKISCPDSKSDKPLFLSPDQKMTYDKRDKSIAVESVDAAKYTSWQNENTLNFENETLAMILPRLEQWFGCKIACSDRIAKHYRFTFKVRDESIERILSMMSKSTPIRYKKNSETNFLIYTK